MSTNLYAERDIDALGEHYTRHVNAMTAEGLHSKSDIAAELAHRDMEIERLRATLQGIAAAEWRTWRDGLASANAFVGWAKERARQALNGGK